MLTIVLSLLFGVIAFAALAQTWLSVQAGLKHGRLIQAELGRAGVRGRSARRPGPVGPPRLAAA